MSKPKMKETKSVPVSAEHKQAVSDFAVTFEAFKAANDARLSSLEAKQAVDPLLSDKVERINTALDMQQKRLDRLALSNSQPVLTQDMAASEVKSAWSRYIRSGDQSALTTLEAKSLSASDGEGGFIVPMETQNTIDAVLSEASPFRTISTVRTIGKGQFKKPISAGGATAGWAGESDARPETTAPELQLVDFPAGELYAMPAATQTLLDDGVADVDQWLADEVRDVFAAQETAAFVSGDGVNKPRGLLNYTQQPDASHTWGNIGYLSTSTEGGFDTDAPVDALIDLIYAPAPRYRSEGRFMMNRRTLAAVRKLKDADGNYVWQPASEAGGASSLLGYAVSEVEDMPDIASTEAAIAFGDFRRGYLIVDRQGVRVLRDPYSAKPYVLFYTTKRVGGGVQDFNAIKLLKFTA